MNFIQKLTSLFSPFCLKTYEYFDLKENRTISIQLRPIFRSIASCFGYYKETYRDLLQDLGERVFKINCEKKDNSPTKEAAITRDVFDKIFAKLEPSNDFDNPSPAFKLDNYFFYLARENKTQENQNNSYHYKLIIRDINDNSTNTNEASFEINNETISISSYATSASDNICLKTIIKLSEPALQALKNSHLNQGNDPGTKGWGFITIDATSYEKGTTFTLQPFINYVQYKNYSPSSDINYDCYKAFSNNSSISSGDQNTNASSVPSLSSASFNYSIPSHATTYP